MENIPAPTPNLRYLSRYTFGIAFVWTLVLVSLAMFNYYDALNYVKLNVIEQARDTFNKDLVLRRWVAGNGGVYVPPSLHTPPNPYLSYIPNRDIVTRSGDQFTLMNPAYVMRQVNELALQQFGLHSHITSLRPLRPENAPDPWEKSALEKISQGMVEISEETTFNGKPFMRLMRPLFVKEHCLKCHDAVQGYKLGQLRGGISVSIALGPVISRHREHMYRIFSVYFLLWTAGILSIYFIFLHNRKQLKKSAEEASYMRRLTSLVEQTPSAIMIIRLDGTAEFVNQGYEKLVGYRAAEIIDKDARELFFIDELREEREELWQTVSQGERWQGEIASRHKNGTVVYANAVAFPLFDDSGEITNYAVIKHDVTETHKLQARLVQAQKMEAVGTLASGVAHDFNNILTVINSFSEILIDECEADSPIREDLVEINDAGRRAAELTRQLLAFSRRQIIQPKELCLRKLIENLMKMMRRLLSEDIELEFSLPENIVPIKIIADPGQIEQILMNLLINARDALQSSANVIEGKRIVLSLSEVELDEDFVISHAGSRPGNFALIEVIDNGCGMNIDAQQHCFEPFFTTKEVGQGTGMGLAMVYGIIKQNMGTVFVESYPGIGTTFRIYWPIIDADEVTIDEKTVVSELKVKGDEVLLVVEDDDKIREVVCRKLRQSGFQVIAADNGVDALQQIENHPETIDLLFTDVVMPLMGGKDLAEKMRELYPRIKIIFASGYLDDCVHKDILALGQFINKPYSAKAMVENIRQCLDGKSV